MSVSLSPTATELSGPRIRTRAEAEAYVASVCFKHGPPTLLGVELEWTVHPVHDPAAPFELVDLITALEPHAPQSLVPDSTHQPLPNGSVLTVEPGGQVEISSLPTSSMASLFNSVTADADYLQRRLAERGLAMGTEGTDPWRPPRRILQVPRYTAMETAFDRIGIGGRLMMCSTAGVQVCLDMGERHRVAARWAALHSLGPVMLAVFANSPRLFGKRTGWSSTRTQCLLRTDPVRTHPAPVTPDPAGSWARRALDTPVVCMRREGPDWSVPNGITFAEWINGALPRPPTLSDLDYHLSTLFPPVRPRGYFEVRYLDTQPGQDWMLPAAAVIALFHDEAVVDEVLERTSPAAGRWVHAAKHGLADTTLARTAESVFELACQQLSNCGCPPELAGRLADFVDRRLRDAALIADRTGVDHA
ncbi:ergothioneine biosynthesis glutamate--cysteine ligase EgtA [Saccharopolyspora rectivirgula]|jgi:glutamate--cysteine ligase|uniref:ergothioneine biosynthesis glutamate--cysteine ligase EgtA n=1 Tax=Saccharopolyspora rectivirgula TaxID=28042 RepID=UPI0004198178|nr:ergothioneine biosynthesis glutamate--cysteine ligase EgtA [Saccharopolyspora rectivirgula]